MNKITREIYVAALRRRQAERVEFIHMLSLTVLCALALGAAL